MLHRVAKPWGAKRVPAPGCEPLLSVWTKLSKQATMKSLLHLLNLQQLLDALSGFCAALGLDVSLAKTQVMCFGLPVAAPPPTCTYAGRTLPHTDSYKYLGTTFTPAGMAGHGLAQVRSNVGRAFNNVRFKFDRLGCTSNIHLQLHLYDAIVTSTALSSCEVWGVHPAAQQQRRRLAALHRRYIRRICRLPDSVPTEALMAELGRMDIETRWLAHTLRFWNSLCDQPPDSLHHQLLLDAQTEALLAGTRNEVWGLRQACQRLDHQVVLSTQTEGAASGRTAYHESGGGTAAAGMGGSQRMPTDMPERGCRASIP